MMGVHFNVMRAIRGILVAAVAIVPRMASGHDTWVQASRRLARVDVPQRCLCCDE